MSFGTRGDGFAIGDAGRLGFDLDVILIAHLFEHDAQMQLADAVEYGFVERGAKFEAQARVLGLDLVQRGRQLLLVSIASPYIGDGSSNGSK